MLDVDRGHVELARAREYIAHVGERKHGRDCWRDAALSLRLSQVQTYSQFLERFTAECRCQEDTIWDQRLAVSGERPFKVVDPMQG